MKLSEFVTTLDVHASQVPIEELTDMLRQLDLDHDEVAHLVKFDDEHYTRTLLHLGPGYVALVMGWKPGQSSPIHDHRQSACGVRVLHGIASETKYDRMPDGTLIAGPTKILRTGHVCGSFDADIHAMLNAEPDENLVTLHVYTPPLSRINTYSLDSREVGTWSDEETAAAQKAALLRVP